MTASGWDMFAPGLMTLTFTDGNFDLDRDNDGLINSGPPASWPALLGGPVGGGSLADFYATEDGSAQFLIPEPASLAVWGLLGLSALALPWWRRKR